MDSLSPIKRVGVPWPASSSVAFHFPWPPTVNSLYANVGNRRVKTAAARRFVKHCIDACLVDKIQRHRFEGKRIALVVSLHAPDRRSYDIDNRAKALLDAMVECGIIDDDSCVDSLTLLRGPSHPVSGRVYVRIREALKYKTEVEEADGL